MKIIKAKDYEDMSRKAANIISAQVILKPDCVLGLATGSTPIVPTSSSLLVREGRRRLCRGQHLQPGRVSRPFARRSPELSLLYA